MTEKERPHEERPYWTSNHELGRFTIAGEDRPLYLKLHRSKERIFKRDEIVPLTVTTGERDYFHAKPFLLLPGGRPRDIGQAQAWHYPADHLLVLWECFFDDHYGLAGQRAEGNANLHKLWDGFERVLLGQLPAAERIVTTCEDEYARPDWKRFLDERGYAQTAPVVFEKRRPTP